MIAELGPDLAAAFPSAGRFCNWLGLSPNPQVTGGRVVKRGTRDVTHRVATIFRLAAFSLAHSNSPLGAFYRRMRAKLGPAATAHKLARIYYHIVTTKEPYDESIFARAKPEEQRKFFTPTPPASTADGVSISISFP